MDRFIYTFLIVVLLGGCADQDASHLLPRYTGAPGEVILVMNDALYEGRAGDVLHEYFTGNAPMLPQSEPEFNLVQLDPSQVNNITRYHRNLLFVHLSTQVDTPLVKAQRNKWSSQQVVVDVRANSISQLDSLMQENGVSIAQKFNEYERMRLQSFYASKLDARIKDTLLARYDLGLTIPNDCELVVKEPHFAWIKRQRERSVGGTMHDVLEGIIVYMYPYTSDSAFSKAAILAVRDSVLKQHIPGPVEGSYMTTEYLLPPESKPVHFNDAYAVETRGLWRTQGAIMGGPFISLTTLDEERQRVVTVEGFVFAPKFDKREYLREVEAIVYSLEFKGSNP